MRTLDNAIETEQRDAVVSHAPAKPAARKRPVQPKGEAQEPLRTEPEAQPAAPRTTDAAANQAIERAEVVLDQAGQRLGELAVTASQRVRRWAALAREEAEDVWAEAQSLRDRLTARRDTHS